MPHQNAILSEDQVIEIKRLLWNGELCRILAKRFEISAKSISAIKNGRTWPEIAWPNGKAGAIEPERNRLLVIARAQPANKEAQKQLRKGAVNNNANRGSKKARR